MPNYAFNAKELDEENGMYYYSARYYAPPTFISRDPMFEEKPWMSPYAYCANSPINKVDPTGEDEYEFDTKAGTFTWLSDKGGSKTDHYNVGQKDEEGKFNSNQTISIDRNGKSNINSFRIEETSKSTISAFHIPDAKEGELSSGFFLEPKGPSTEKANQNQRIPEGSYDVMKNDGKDYPGVPKLFNSDVSKERGILIHNGNLPDHTRGCLLIGTTKGTDWVGKGNSVTTLGKMNDYMNNRGYSNIKVNIFNVIKK
jgi:RHS repeat-associated protein